LIYCLFDLILGNGVPKIFQNRIIKMEFILFDQAIFVN
jgi:hypothetical protein